jgi:hypothetical protein
MCHRMPARSEERERLVGQLEEWRQHHGAQWALTLALGVSPTGHFDPEAALKPHLRKLLKQLACEVFGVPRRQLGRLNHDTAPFFVGVYESHDRFERPWPHIHGCIALRGQSEALLRGVLRDRWGMDQHPAKPAIIGRDKVAVAVPSREVAPRAAIARPGYRPSFSLTPIRTDNWLGGYSTKMTNVRNVSVWTAPEILNLAA